MIEQSPSMFRGKIHAHQTTFGIFGLRHPHRRITANTKYYRKFNILDLRVFDDHRVCLMVSYRILQLSELKRRKFYRRLPTEVLMRFNVFFITFLA